MGAAGVCGIKVLLPLRAMGVSEETQWGARILSAAQHIVLMSISCLDIVLQMYKIKMGYNFFIEEKWAKVT